MDVSDYVSLRNRARNTNMRGMAFSKVSDQTATVTFRSLKVIGIGAIREVTY